MKYIEFEEAVNGTHMVMGAPHSHDFYELYFLLEGQRDFFIGNKMFRVDDNTLVVVPPFSMHKTEGGAYRRINANVSASLLTKTQIDFLTKISEKTAIKITGKYLDVIVRLLSEATRLQNRSLPDKTDGLCSILKTVLLFLSLQDNASVSAASAAFTPSEVSSDILKIIYYINTHFCEQITLDELCTEFYLSRTSLCKKFRDVMRCSIIEYVSELRLNKAKSLLRDTGLTIDEISTSCGYSSPNYFGLIFKKEVGLSPLQYRKSR